MIHLAEDTALCERLVLQTRLEQLLRGEDSVNGENADERLSELALRFDLSPFEKDAIGLLWVLAFAPPLWRLCTQEDGCVTPLLVARVFGHAPCAWLASEAPSLLWGLLSESPLPSGGSSLHLDPHILAWLEGSHELDRPLRGHARGVPVAHSLPSWPLDSETARVRDGMRDGTRWRIILRTPDGLAAESYAAQIAKKLGLPLLYVEGSAFTTEEARSQGLRIHRQAYLDRVAPMLGTSKEGVFHPGTVQPFPVQFVWSEVPLPAVPGLRDLELDVAPPTEEERLLLWGGTIPSAAAWPVEDLRELARSQEADLGEILRVASRAPRDAQEAARMLRQSSPEDLGGLAQRLECSFVWEDLVLPAPVSERLQDIAFEARERVALWGEAGARRIFPQGRSLVALFAGPPGTGKTMAAQVIAAELGMDLLRVDLSAVLSKWVGETSQHLQKLLSARRSRRAVLFFDEADALYGKRVEEVKDAQDRFANMDISHLMVALEAYDGIVLLATNLKANIDPAFIRRIRHLVDFPRPDIHARHEIWKRTLQALFGDPVALRLERDLERISVLETTGAQIKNAALAVAFASRKHRGEPDLDLLGRMVARELAKDGGGLSDRDLRAVLDAAERQS